MWVVVMPAGAPSAAISLRMWRGLATCNMTGCHIVGFLVPCSKRQRMPPVCKKWRPLPSPPIHRSAPLPAETPARRRAEDSSPVSDGGLQRKFMQERSFLISRVVLESWRGPPPVSCCEPPQPHLVQVRRPAQKGGPFPSGSCTCAMLCQLAYWSDGFYWSGGRATAARASKTVAQPIRQHFSQQFAQPNSTARAAINKGAFYCLPFTHHNRSQTPPSAPPWQRRRGRQGAEVRSPSTISAVSEIWC